MNIFDLQKRVETMTEQGKKAQQDQTRFLVTQNIEHKKIEDLPSGFYFKTVPKQHQIDTLFKAHDRRYFAYFMEMGTGKSKILIDEIAYLYGKGLIDAVIILPNKGSYLNWVENELPTHMPEHIPLLVTYWDSQASTALQASYDKLLKPFAGLKIIVMNIEALAYERASKFALRFVKTHKTLGAVDESTTIKNPKAKRTRAAIQVGEHCLYRRIMTGSPVTKNPLDLYSQSMFLGENILGFSSYYSFRARYAEMIVVTLGARSFKKIKEFRHLDELSRNIQPWSYRVLKEDCLDLPPKIYEVRYVELTDEQKRLYKQIKDEAYATLNGVTVTAPLAITKILRLHQIVCGHLVDEEQKATPIPSNRMDVLLDTLEENSGKAIIFAVYRKDVVAITEKLNEEYGPGSAVSYYGETSKDDRVSAIKRFQTDPNCRFFVANKTGAYGITLTAANLVVYYANSFDLEVRLQSEDRPHRIGQEKAVTYVDLVARGTVDQKIVKALKEKKNLADLVLGDGWRAWLE